MGDRTQSDPGPQALSIDERSMTAFALLRIYAALLLLIGIVLVGGGAYLLSLGGSPYYVLCGLALAASGLLLWRRRAEGAALYAAVLLATLAWALWEAGYDGWALMPRIVAPAVLGLVLLIPSVGRILIRRRPARSFGYVCGAVASAVIVGIALHIVVPSHIVLDPIYETGIGKPPLQDPTAAPLQPSDGEWLYYGKDLQATRFSPLKQITARNVSKLELVWTARVGPAPTGLEATPIKVARALYLCNNVSDLFALDVETGKQLWRFDAHADRRNVPNPVCRGVAYYHAPNAVGPCADRIISNTIDGRLIAVDAPTGTPCPDFGLNGQVSLLAGMGEVIPGYYKLSSAPTIVAGNVVLGGSVNDNQYWGEPSGVIRAFDAVTGRLAWAWDVGHPDRQGEPPSGEAYTRPSPNAWAPMSADGVLGLVFVPLGPPTPDYYGVLRRPFDEAYSTSLVALDATTGRPRWSFQAVHHDLWDYDLPSAPSLVDIRTARGIVPALVQPTKTGELFVLNRATGEALFPVEEHPVSARGALPEERLSATQPFSVGMPSFRGTDLVESDMWGVTPLDQLWCRIKFREARYDGIYTPPGLRPAVHYPGFAGGMEWGGVAIDVPRNIAIINSNNVPNYVQLITRAQADRLGMKPATPDDPRLNDFGRRAPQAGTPYGVLAGSFMSPLDVPCTQPPYGRLSAVDLTTGKLIWTRAFGTADNVGPFGIPSKLPFALGTFNLGGATVTGGGVFFIGATQDRYLRAYETATGRELWKTRLPAGGAATPMTYVSPDSGRQFVVVAAAGALGIETRMGDYIMAFALPKGD